MYESESALVWNLTIWPGLKDTSCEMRFLSCYYSPNTTEKVEHQQIIYHSSSHTLLKSCIGTKKLFSNFITFSLHLDGTILDFSKCIEFDAVSQPNILHHTLDSTWLHRCVDMYAHTACCILQSGGAEILTKQKVSVLN